MSNLNDTILLGGLPALLNVSISTVMPHLQSQTAHVTPTTRTMAPASASKGTSTSTPPDYVKLHTALGSNSLVKSAITTIPKLTGNEDYIIWSDQLMLGSKTAEHNI